MLGQPKWCNFSGPFKDFITTFASALAYPHSGFLIWIIMLFASLLYLNNEIQIWDAKSFSPLMLLSGIGYNGFPRGCSDDKLPWAKKSRTDDPLETKYPYVCHAEVNAILNTNHASAAGQKLYVTMFPCNECAKIIIQSGVSEVVYFVAKRLNDSNVAYIASHKLLSMAGVKVRKHQPHMSQILLQFEER
ncbi:uncharacterized protein LOC107418008 isoform X2 [Ziziphus jujuba]|uniref:dCMP deaminase n=1 Tax=Ziziphus jujuba TaxID=326968 RepID=A0A6P6G6N3_ZIZJJ|nr:uncharacterized protein LOC107418008 isoform X2 [Ziziphus jujuba]XP_024929767.1 uncharacterized protein LOC107418008 isoform X2 [Ziziphus jujuba]XP_024929768.1 uncharacterized protein LOC107418008 isoform X2 [Ziziphus jujuba]